MSKEEQAKVMEKLDLTQLNSQEMRQLRDLDIIDNEKLLDIYSKALEHCENEREEESERADVAEMEKDRFQIRADAAEVFFRENCLWSILYMWNNSRLMVLLTDNMVKL